MKAKSEYYGDSENLADGCMLLHEHVDVVGTICGGCVGNVSGMFGESLISTFSVLMFSSSILMLSSIISVLFCSSMLLVVGSNQVLLKLGGRTTSFTGCKFDLFECDIVGRNCVVEGVFFSSSTIFLYAAR